MRRALIAKLGGDHGGNHRKGPRDYCRLHGCVHGFMPIPSTHADTTELRSVSTRVATQASTRYDRDATYVRLVTSSLPTVCTPSTGPLGSAPLRRRARPPHAPRVTPMTAGRSRQGVGVFVTSAESLRQVDVVGEVARDALTQAIEHLAQAIEHLADVVVTTASH